MAEILGVALLCMMGAALYNAGRNDGYQAGYRDAVKPYEMDICARCHNIECKEPLEGGCDEFLQIWEDNENA